VGPARSEKQIRKDVAEALGWRREAREAILNPEKTAFLVDELMKVHGPVERMSAPVRWQKQMRSDTVLGCQTDLPQVDSAKNYLLQSTLITLTEELSRNDLASRFQLSTGHFYANHKPTLR
jgi:hypothetical protein